MVLAERLHRHRMPARVKGKGRNAQKTLNLPLCNAEEAILLGNNKILAIEQRLDIVNHLSKHKVLIFYVSNPTTSTAPDLDLQDVQPRQKGFRNCCCRGTQSFNDRSSGHR